MHPFEDLVVPEGAVGIHWFGQSTFALKDSGGTIVQVDPYYPHERPADGFIHKRPPLNEDSLRTDFILLTHDHGDHTCAESVNRIRASYPAVRYVCPAESTETLVKEGAPPSHFTTVTAGEKASMGSMTVWAVWSKAPEGLPGDSIDPPDVQHLGYVVDAGGVRVYISGDLVNSFGDQEFLLQPIRDLEPDIGFLTNHPDEGEFPGFPGSARMAVELGLKTAVPAHYECFVSRNYDPQEWASHLPAGGPQPLIIPSNQAVVYSPPSA